MDRGVVVDSSVSGPQSASISMTQDAQERVATNNSSNRRVAHGFASLPEFHGTGHFAWGTVNSVCLRVMAWWM